MGGEGKGCLCQGGTQKSVERWSIQAAEAEIQTRTHLLKRLLTWGGVRWSNMTWAEGGSPGFG